MLTLTCTCMCVGERWQAMSDQRATFTTSQLGHRIHCRGFPVPPTSSHSKKFQRRMRIEKKIKKKRKKKENQEKRRKKRMKKKKREDKEDV